jgi:hypothetical protein
VEQIGGEDSPVQISPKKPRLAGVTAVLTEWFGKPGFCKTARQLATNNVLIKNGGYNYCRRVNET